MVTASKHVDLIEYAKECLEAVEGVGKVHTFPRDRQDTLDIETDFTANEIINAWIIQRQGVQASTQGVPSRHEYRLHEFVIRGYYQLSDDLASEITFQELCNDIMNSLIIRRQKSSAEALAHIEDTDRLAMRMTTFKLANAYWVHYAEIDWVMRERIKDVGYFGVSS
jgi:copper chaperone CopZ